MDHLLPKDQEKRTQLQVMVTGADGLLGSNLVRRLLEMGFSVRVLVHPKSSSPTLRGLTLETFSGDLLSEDSVLAEASRGCDAVFHCAAITNMWADPQLTWEVNLKGTEAVLKACLREGVKRLVHIGSASSFAFGPMQNPGDERSPFAEVYRGMAYMESKHEAMKLVREWVTERGLDAVIVAPTFLLGKYDYGPSGGELIRQYLKRGLKYVPPGGRNFANAGDVARAAILAWERGKAGEAYIAGGENLRYFDFFSAVSRIAGTRPPVRVIPKALVLAAGAAGSAYKKIPGKTAQVDLRIARVSCYETYYSSEKALAELGMTQTPIDVAIEDSIESLREYGHIQ